MNIQLHIERLVLDGLSLSANGERFIQASVEQELARLVAAGGLSTQFASSCSIATIEGTAIRGANRMSPMSLGKGIADAVYSGIGDAKCPSR